MTKGKAESRMEAKSQTIRKATEKERERSVQLDRDGFSNNRPHEGKRGGGKNGEEDY